MLCTAATDAISCFYSFCILLEQRWYQDEHHHVETRAYQHAKMIIEVSKKGYIKFVGFCYFLIPRAPPSSLPKLWVGSK